MLKTKHAALAHGQAGGSPQWVDTGNDQVLVFERRQGTDAVRVAVNLGPQAQAWRGMDGETGSLAPWSWRIVVR